MNKSRKLLARGLAICVATSVLWLPTAAFAADGDDVHGDTGASWGPRDAAGEARLAQLHAEATNTGASPNSVCPFVATHLTQTESVTPEASSRLLVMAASSCPGIPPVSRSLGIAWQQQTTGYWCGPTTVAMASTYFGTNKTQAQVASHIGTTTAGSDRAQVANGMNWVGNRTTYTPISAPSAQGITDSLRADIGLGGVPVAVNTHETATASDHYNNHPNRDIGHFVLAVGYVSGGQTVTINDPAAGLSSGYQNSASQFSITAASLATFVNDRGIVA